MKRNSHMVVMLILRPLLPVLKSAFLYTYAFLQISLKEPLVTTTLMLSVVSTSKCGKKTSPSDVDGAVSPRTTPSLKSREFHSLTCFLNPTLQDRAHLGLSVAGWQRL